MKNKLKNTLIILYICVAILSFVVILLIPATREWFKMMSKNHAYVMGFVKFALLATAGELIAGIIASKKPTLPPQIILRFIIWGLIGVWITFMMGVYKIASTSLVGNNNLFVMALLTSVLMNTSFGPTFMAVHKITDRILELLSKKEKITFNSVVGGINWSKFVSFTILITVPFFWIPAHTITFMLPSEYQVMMAAALSVALGVFLSFGSRKKQAQGVK